MNQPHYVKLNVKIFEKPLHIMHAFIIERHPLTYHSNGWSALSVVDAMYATLNISTSAQTLQSVASVYFDAR